MFAVPLFLAATAGLSDGQCGSPCSSDADCISSTACSWCRSPAPGKGNKQTCSGPPDPNDCGTLPTAPKNASITQYACFGDSVSKGIFRAFTKVATHWESFHPSSNMGGGCGNTVRGKDCTRFWLYGKAATHRKWDIISFNFGLHDLALDSEHVTTAIYKDNLRNISRELQAATPHVFWVSSTPVPNVTLNPPRKQSDVPLYNSAAAEVMADLSIPIIDLYAFVISQCGNNPHYTTCPGFQQQGGVHFEAAGYNKMAEFIYTAIKKAYQSSNH